MFRSVCQNDSSIHGLLLVQMVGWAPLLEANSRDFLVLGSKFSSALKKIVFYNLKSSLSQQTERNVTESKNKVRKEEK